MSGNLPPGISPEQREWLRDEESKRTKEWIAQRVWDLCDDIGQGYNQTDKLSDGEAAAYARGVYHSLEAMAERSECGGEIKINSLIEGALGERYRRNNSPAGKLKRRLFDKLITQIRDKRIAMLDRYESLGYRDEYEVWRKRVWAIERQGVASEEYDEFNRLRHELEAIWLLSSWLMGSRNWRDKNWAARQPVEVKVAA